MTTVTTTTSAIAYARMQARAHWSPIVNTGTVICRRCKKPITPDPTKKGNGWEAGHPTSAPAANGNIADDLAPEHTDCNRSGVIVDQAPTFAW